MKARDAPAAVWPNPARRGKVAQLLPVVANFTGNDLSRPVRIDAAASNAFPRARR
jgi:hypothetical protein